LKGERGIIQMRKHLGWYLQQVPGTTGLRQKAVKICNLEDVAELLAQATEQFG
jgi:tRNA-dihydrouridine synthase